MSSDNAPSSPNKPVSSSFADVFKTLGVGRPKSHSPVSLTDSTSDSSPHISDGRRSTLAALGLDQMHRGSIISSSSDTPSGPDFEASFKTLAQKQNLTLAIEEAEIVSKSLQWFSSEQSVSLWEAGAYLLHHETCPEARRAGSRLLEAVAARQDLTPAARLSIFESISYPSEADVIPARVQSLISLSDHGRKLDFTSSSILPIVSSCVVPLYELISSARSKARKAKVTKPNGLGEDEASLADLLQFAVDLMTLQRRPPTSEEIESLLAQIVTICKRTSVAADIKNSLAVFDAVILYADVPDNSFVPLLEILCGIHASVKSLSGPTSRAVRNLAKSPRKLEMVNALNSFLQESSEEHGRNLNILRGTIYVFTDLVRAHGQAGIPEIPFEQLVSSLGVVAKKDDSRVDADILELCVDILEGEYIHLALDQNWSGFVGLLTSCSRRAVEEEDEFTTTTTPMSQQSQPKANLPDDMKSNILANVVRIASVIESLWEKLSRDQRLETIKFLRNVRRHIEPSQASLTLHTIRSERLCFPENLGWEQHCSAIIDSFIRSPLKTTGIRIFGVEILAEAFLNHESFDLFQGKGFLNLILENFVHEDDILFLESLVSFAVDASIYVNDDDTFRFLVDTISSPMSKDQDRDGSQGVESPGVSSPERQLSTSTSTLEPSLANVCSAGLVRMFLRFLNVSAKKALLVFETIMNIAQSPSRPTDSRLTALKLLFRLRCDSAGAIMVISPSENDFLVNILDLAGGVGPKMQAPLDEGYFGRTSSSRASKLTPPLWAYGSPQVLPEEPPETPSTCVYAYGAASSEVSESTGKAVLKANMWLETVLLLLQRETNWDIYSYALAHLGSQLRNRDLFTNAIPQIKLLRSILCDQVKNESFREPPVSTGIKKADVASCIFESLSILVSYHEYFAKSEEDDLIRAFMLGIIGSWGSTSRECIHALSVCCHEVPMSVTKSLNGILDKMSKMITMPNLAVHILEFLALLGRLPDVYINLREEEIRTVFGICIRFLQTSRESRYKASESAARSPQAPGRISGVREVAYSQTDSPDLLPQDGMAKYIYTLTHHVMVFWFLSMKLQDRVKHVNWIMSRLVFKDEFGKDMVEEQSQVFIDLMQRVTFSDLGDTIPFETFPPSPSDGAVVKKSWVVGMSIVTVETAKISGLTQLTKRQASGTTYAMYQQRTAPVLPHQVPTNHDAHLYSDSMRTAVLPNHVMIQLSTTAFPLPTVVQPIPLPDDDITRRAISNFDRTDIIDGHKVGVVYVGEGQTTEAAILSNTSGSADYEFFLSGLGTKVPLEGAAFNTQGLYPGVDGDQAYAWRDRVTEIVYHVATMMPSDPEGDPNCVNKKRHVGNDHVNIVFNRSNAPFNFHTIPSQFNFVNIVISPVCRISKDEPGSANEETPDFEKLYYHVQVLSKPGFPEISPAANPKIISGRNLAAFVRILALNASVFSLIWNSHDGEHISSWRNRLREIKRVRERAQAQMSEPSESTYPAHRRNTHANIYTEELPVRPAPVRPDFAADWNTAADGNILHSLDFSRWSR
ncbi:GTPase Activating Protein [Aspergillus sclerotialis]|uniref:GTPase Activating Protein n=1 Tax=Aspergillus sclerotialis TaxID=2070753 RepID=A0A3A3A6Q7_9EURO|nr:GTPase Activating Protein [Aspergillus sclerotialis]